MAYKKLLLVTVLVCGVVFWADSSQFAATAAKATKSAGQTLLMFKEKHKETYYNGKIKVKGIIAQVCLTPSKTRVYNCPVGAKQVHVRQGVWTWWWPNGKKMAERRYHLGHLQGKVTVWFSNGAIRWTEFYKNGKRDGLRTTYFIKGSKKRVEEYTEGSLNGVQTVFWPNGKKASLGSFKAGKRTGLWKSYYINGDVKEEIHFDKGLRNGRYILWRSICQPAGCAPIKTLQGRFKNGKKDGTWVRWFYDAENKQQRSEVNWKDGRKTL